LSFDTPKLTARDYVMGGTVVFGALAILFSVVFAMTRIVNAWFPVGCTP
jgi:Na+-transporting methylmalonyl-CoA/oxaloacetate decarboxylase gamma subunit